MPVDKTSVSRILVIPPAVFLGKRVEKMTLGEQWSDFICFAIVGIAFLGSLFLILLRQFAKPAIPARTCNRNTMYESLIVISKEEDESSNTRTAHCSSFLWNSCWRGLCPVWLLAFRFFSFAVLSVVLALDFQEYGASIFVYYTEWTFVLVIIYFAIATTVSARGCLQYYTEKTPTENGNRREDHFLYPTGMPQGIVLTDDTPLVEKENQNSTISQSRHGQPGIFGYLMQATYQACAGAVVLTDVIFWLVIVPFLPNVHLQLNMLMGCMHTLNAVTLLIDTSINSLPFPWFGLAYFVLWSCCYILFQWIIHACGFTWWPYPFLDLSTTWAALWYFCLAAIHIPCYGFYWLVVSARDSLLRKLYLQNF